MWGTPIADVVKVRGIEGLQDARAGPTLKNNGKSLPNHGTRKEQGVLIQGFGEGRVGMQPFGRHDVNALRHSWLDWSRGGNHLARSLSGLAAAMRVFTESAA